MTLIKRQKQYVDLDASFENVFMIIMDTNFNAVAFVPLYVFSEWESFLLNIVIDQSRADVHRGSRHMAKVGEVREERGESLSKIAINYSKVDRFLKIM